MPRSVDIPDVGTVEFPDSMDDKQVVEAIQHNILPDHRARALKVVGLREEQQALEEQPDPSVGKLFLQQASEPFVGLPKPEVQPGDSGLVKFGKGFIRSAEGLVESVESPLGVALGVTAMLPGAPLAVAAAQRILGKVAGTGFGALAVKGGLEKAQEAYQEGDPAKAGEATGDLLGGALLLKGTLSGGKSARPLTDQALADTRPLVQLPGEESGVVSAPAPAGVPEANTPITPPEQPAPKPPPAPWTLATDESASSKLGTELFAGIPNPVHVAKAVVKLAGEAGPHLKEAGDTVIESATKAADSLKEIGQDTVELGQMTDYRRAVLNWSAKQQRSFSEASTAQEELAASIISGEELAKEAAHLNVFEKTVRKAHLEGMTNWIQAGGDMEVLKARASATTDPALKAGYEAAQHLTPAELKAAQAAKATFDALGTRGQQYDIVNELKQNYVTQVWDIGKGPAVGANRVLREQFRFNRASTFDTYFDGEQAGYKPRTKDLSRVLPMYIHEMNKVIADRQLVAELSQGLASDGRPLVAPRGVGVPAGEAANRATLVMPHATPKSMAESVDYKVLENQPALNKWRWAAKDESGNAVMLKSDLALHPEAYAKLKNVLGKSAVKAWYENKTGDIGDVPKWLVQTLEAGQAGTKKLMLGLLSPFHQVQEGTHAVGHRVSPFDRVPEIDLAKDASQYDAARHGLMLESDRASANQFMEGFKTSALIAHIPVLGPMAEWYQNYLFHQYIPGLKYKTYLAALGRNKEVFAKELGSGKANIADVKALTAEQINAAYGHLNYADLARDPTIQHMLQLFLLAPDFLEARARFTGQAAKGLVGFKSGREQTTALATLAVAQAAAAYTGAQLVDGEWDGRHPFEFHKDNRTYTMRSVPEDVSSLIKNWQQFTGNRLSPWAGRSLTMLTQHNWMNQKVTPADVAAEMVESPIPLSLRSFLSKPLSSAEEKLGVHVYHSDLSAWEQLAGTIGLRVSRYNPDAEMQDVVQAFKANSGDKKLVAEAERAAQETNAHSDYMHLRHSLLDSDFEQAKKEYAKLLETKSEKQINHAMRPDHPVTGSKALEPKFVAALNERNKKLYEATKASHALLSERYQQMKQSQ